MLRMLKFFLLDLFFPPRCVICDKLGTFLCPDCQAEIVIIKTQSCPKCERIAPQGRYCRRCRKGGGLMGIVSLGYLKNEPVRKIVYDIKFHGYFAVCTAIAPLLLEVIEAEKIKFDLIAFVPSSKKRHIKRGYNQSEILAKELGNLTRKPVFQGLVKKADTKPQVGLKKRQRELNLYDVFAVTKPGVKGKRILLIDDVVTTGATLNECANALRKAGARTVTGATIAKE